MPSTKALLPADEEGHVGAQRSAQRQQPLARPVQAPQPVQRQQRAGRVGTAAAQAGAPGHAACRSRCRRPARVPLAACSARAARRHRSSAGSGGAEVVARQRGRRARSSKCRRVAPVDQHEHRLQQVVAVGAPPDHVQEQVQLGRRRHVVERAQAHGVGSVQRGRAAVHRRRRRRAAPAACRRREARQVDRPAELLEAGPGCSGGAGSARRARAGRAASRAARASGSASPKRLARQRVQVGEAAFALRRDQHAPRPGAQRAARQRRAQRRAQAQLAALGVAAQVEAGAERLRRPVRRGPRPAAPAGRRARRARRGGGGVAQPASGQRRQQRGARAALTVDLQADQRLAQHVVGGVAAARFGARCAAPRRAGPWPTAPRPGGRRSRRRAAPA